MSTLIKPLDKYIYLGELAYRLKFETDRVLIIDKLTEYYKKNKKRLHVKKILDLDGLSVICADYWFNIRPSNTEPLLRFRIEGKNRKKLEKIRNDVEKSIPAK